MAVRLNLENTPSPMQRHPVHPIPLSVVHEPIVIHSVDASLRASSKTPKPTKFPFETTLQLDPFSATLSVGPYTFRTGCGVELVPHLQSSKMNIMFKSRRLVISFPSSSKASDRQRVFGQLELFSWSPRSFTLLSPIAMGSVSVTFAAWSSAANAIVAVRQTRQVDLRYAGADGLVKKTSALLKAIPDCDTAKDGVLKPELAYWDDGVFNTVSPLYTSIASATATDSSSTSNVYDDFCANFTDDDYARVRHITRQLLKTLSHLHASGVVHGHVNRSHVLLDEDDSVKLTGFGHATLSSPPKGKKKREGSSLLDWHVDEFTPLGKCAYAQSQPQAKSAKNDVLCVGNVLHALLHNGDDSADIPLDLQSLLKALLQPSAEKRLTARAALEHVALAEDVIVFDREEEDRKREKTLFSSPPVTPTSVIDHACTDDDGSVAEMARIRFQSAVHKVSTAVRLVARLQASAGTATYR